jgi:hypothetical protein
LLDLYKIGEFTPSYTRDGSSWGLRDHVIDYLIVIVGIGKGEGTLTLV